MVRPASSLPLRKADVKRLSWEGVRSMFSLRTSPQSVGRPGPDCRNADVPRIHFCAPHFRASARRSDRRWSGLRGGFWGPLLSGERCGNRSDSTGPGVRGRGPERNAASGNTGARHQWLTERARGSTGRSQESAPVDRIGELASAGGRYRNQRRDGRARVEPARFTNRRRMTIKTTMSLALCLAGLLSAEVSSYVLGPGDQVTVSLRDRKEIEIKPARIGPDGTVELSYAGSIHAEGLSTQQLAKEIESRLAKIVQNPMVTVDVSDYGSQPVSVLGAVNRPGVHQLRGSKSLVEVLSLAEGLKNEAGNSIEITRPNASGPIPLPNAKEDATGRFMTAEVKVKGLMDATVPEANIPIRAHDVITVPRAELVYVLGKVHR